MANYNVHIAVNPGGSIIKPRLVPVSPEGTKNSPGYNLINDPVVTYGKSWNNSISGTLDFVTLQEWKDFQVVAIDLSFTTSTTPEANTFKISEGCTGKDLKLKAS